MGALAGALVTRRRHSTGELLFAAALTAAVAVPIIAVASLSAGHPWWAEYSRAFSRPEIRRIFAHTIVIALATAFATILLALPAAITIAFARHRVRLALLWAFTIAGFSPFLVRGYAFVGLLGEHGPAEALRQLLGIPGGPLVGTAAGVVITLTHALIPTAVIILVAAFSSGIKRQLAVASAFGAGPAHRFFVILLPNMFGAIASAFVFTFIISAGAFTAPALVGGGRETLAAQVIYMYAVDMDNLRSAAALSLILALLVLVIAVGLISAAMRSRSGDVRVSRRIASVFRATPPRVLQHVGAFLQMLLTVLALVLVVGPLFYVIGVSFQPQDVLAFPQTGMSLRWYRQVFADASWIRAALTTMRIGIVAAFIATTIAYLASWTVRRLSNGAAARAVQFAALAPAAAPGVMFAIGVYTIALRIHLTGTELGVALAHALAALPVAYLALSASLTRYDENFDRMASSLGASPMARLVSVRIPLLMPGLVAAMVLSLLVSFDEVIMTLFVAGTDVQTIALRMWSSAIQSAGPELAVPSAVLLAVTGLSVVVVFTKMGGPTSLTARGSDR